MIRRPPRSTLDRSSAASDVYKRQGRERLEGDAASVHHGGGHHDGPAALEPGALAERGRGAIAEGRRLDRAACAQARLVALLERAVGEQPLRRELAGDAEAKERAAGHGPAVAVQA